MILYLETEGIVHMTQKLNPRTVINFLKIQLSTNCVNLFFLVNNVEVILKWSERIDSSSLYIWFFFFLAEIIL